ncbi:hypothetical protein [Acuticoccus sp.]|uniref:hypothetical protein n=1 Tax=Acuticoccus sp. TaxID=1904378 RepID=UPI003B5296BC
MTHYLTPERLHLAAASAGYALETSAMPALGPAPTDGARTGRVVAAATWDVLLQAAEAGVDGLLLVEPEDGGTFALAPSVLSRLAAAFGEREFLWRSGRIVLDRAAHQLLWVATRSPAAALFAAALDAQDPANAPKLVGVGVSLLQPWHGEGVYAAEQSRGTYMRWQGPEPVMRLGFGEVMEAFTARNVPLVRVDLTVGMMHLPELLALAQVTVAGGVVPTVVARHGEFHTLSLIVMPATAALQTREGIGFDISVTVPLALRGIVEGREDGGRSFTYAVHAVGATGFFSDRDLPLGFAPVAGPRDEVDAALAALRRRASPVAGSQVLSALHADTVGAEGVRRATALNAFVGEAFFHRLQARVGPTAGELVVDRPVRRTTPTGYVYLSAGPTLRLPFVGPSGVELDRERLPEGFAPDGADRLASAAAVLVNLALNAP